MTVTIKGCTVSFATDLSQDDFETISKLLFLVKGVVDVTPHLVDSTDHVNRMQIREEFAQRIFKALYGEQEA
jgi:hypothetical protein